MLFHFFREKKKKRLRLWKRRAQAFRLKRLDFRLQVLALLPLAHSETSALLIHLAEPQTQQSNGNNTDLTDLIRVRYTHPLPSFPSGNTYHHSLQDCSVAGSLPHCMSTPPPLSQRKYQIEIHTKNNINIKEHAAYDSLYMTFKKKQN